MTTEKTYFVCENCGRSHNLPQGKKSIFCPHCRSERVKPFEVTREMIQKIEQNCRDSEGKSLNEQFCDSARTMRHLKLDSYYDNVTSFYEINPFFLDDSGIFWFWKNSRYVQKNETDILNLLDEELGFLGQTISSGVKNNYLEAFRRVGRKHIPKKTPPEKISFKNGVYDLKSGAIEKPSSEFFFTNVIPWDISKSEETPTLDKLFLQWVGQKHTQTLYEIIAYCCYADYPIQVILCLVGCGRNGKGCFLKVLDKFIGGDNVTSTCLDLIAGNNRSRFESFRLYKKLVALMGETNFGLLSNTSLLKQLCGGDRIGYEAKGKTPFSDYNYAKIMIASNSLPTSLDSSDGFFRRWFIVDFPNEFPEGKDIVSTIPDAEFESLALKVVKILPELIKNGKFTHQGTIEERKSRYIMSSNPLPWFLDKYCERHFEGFCWYNELYKAYLHALSINKKRKVSRKEFKTALEDEGLFVEKRAKLINGAWISGFCVEGISLLLDNLDNLDKFSTQLPEAKISEWENREKSPKCPKPLEIFQKEEEIEQISSISELLSYVQEHQNDHESGADAQKLAEFSKNPQIDQIIEMAKTQGLIAEHFAGFLLEVK